MVCELLPPDNIHRPLDRRPVFTFFQSGRLGGNFFGTVRVVALYTELRAWVPNTTIVGAQMDTRLKPKTVPVVDVWELAHRYDFPGTISRKALWYARRNLRRQAQKEAKR